MTHTAAYNSLDLTDQSATATATAVEMFQNRPPQWRRPRAVRTRVNRCVGPATTHWWRGAGLAVSAAKEVVDMHRQLPGHVLAAIQQLVEPCRGFHLQTDTSPVISITDHHSLLSKLSVIM